jgi:hypothetical protein
MTVGSSQTMHDSSSSTRTTFAWGVSTFAGAMLAIVAIFQILEGIAAIAKDDIYVRGIDYTYEFDVTAWGWVHLIVGVIALGTGIGVVVGQTWAYVTGVVIAFLSALANFAFLPHYPVWSIVVIAFDVLVVWALCTRISRGDPT